MKAPEVHVGIMKGSRINFRLHGEYRDQHGRKYDPGNCEVKFYDEKILFEHHGSASYYEETFSLDPVNIDKCTFELSEVKIGIDFHWERKENQVFKGGLKFIIEDKYLWAVNTLPVEDYLVSVVSSEMSATSSIEFLKAHAVISRSWLLAQLNKNKNLQSAGKTYFSQEETALERIRWYDREDHLLFDVCADDHCQRYQGVTRAHTSEVEKAVNQTCGQVVTYKGNICDTRFSKCCGGITESFENVWEPISHPYLKGIIDKNESINKDLTDLTDEKSAESWILGNPDAFCNTKSKRVLSQVLTDYDQETYDFFRWKISYPQAELSQLVHERTGIDFGLITDLIPIQRGVSGRLIRLKIIGTKKTFIIGKELEIRKALSRKHLYSSAFVIDKKEIDHQLVFTLLGAGWGHGVGLCQIGAAVMGDMGYNYKEILKHYFRGADLAKRY